MTTFTKITISGVEFNPNNCRVNKTIGEINSSSTFTMNFNNYTGRFTGSFTIGDEVKVFADKDINPPTTQIFLGILEDTNFSGREESERLRLSGRDYSARLIDRNVEPEVYTNLPAGSIVKDIIAKYTDDITVTNVDDGQIVDRITFNHIPVFDAIKQLANFTEFSFFVDNDKDLHFKEKDTVASGFIFDNTNITKSSFREKRNEIYNEIWVYGDRYLDGFQDTFTGDGTGSVFTLTNSPHSTVITVDSNLVQPGAIFNMSFTAGSNVKYLVNFDDKQIVFTSGTQQGDNIPGNGSAIIVDYQRDLPIVKFGDDDDSIAKYGKRVKTIIDKSIKDPITAETILLRNLEEFADPLKQGVIDIRNVVNITPGETAVVDIPFYNINNVTYTMLEAKYDFTKRNLLADSVLSLKVNKRNPDITDTLKSIILEQRKIQSQDINIADLLTRYKLTTGSFGIRHSGVEVSTRFIGSDYIWGNKDAGSNIAADWTWGSGIWLGSHTFPDFNIVFSGGFF